VARNRKRAKDRRTRRPPQPGSARRGYPTATHEPASGLEPEENGVPEHPEDDVLLDEPQDDGAPDPIEHAMPDVELADAQLAVGRPAEPEDDDGADEDEFELEVEESIQAGGRRGGRGGGGDGSAPGASELAAPGPAHVEHKAGVFERLIAFLQGSWRELQRVQWPDRRQVMQATGVVIGFVIVAAAFLGLADLVAQKLVTFVLK
jgi:preprotein translocase SecE subunit